MKVNTLAMSVAIGLICMSAVFYSGKAIAGAQFNVSSLKATYAAIYWGKLAGTGVFICDGKGHFTGRETFTIGTKVCEATIKGTYTVNPDGRGTDSADFTTTTPGCKGGHYTQSLVIAGSGKLVLLSNTNGDHLNEEWHLQK